MQIHRTSKKPLGVFALIMINVIAIDSLRNLSLNAQLGFGVVFYYLIAGLVFLVPCGLITAQLATALPQSGGVYIWVKQAFGPRWGFFNVWLQWIYNVFWYPTILVFIASNLAYLIHPALAHDAHFMILTAIVMFTVATIISSLGMQVSGALSIISALLGTLVPMLLVIGLACVWLSTHPISAGVPLQPASDAPTASIWHALAIFNNVLFSLMGLEMSAVHAGDVRNPRRDYPKALLFSSIMILLTLTLASLALLVIIPHGQLDSITGIDQALSAFLNQLSLPHWLPVAVGLIILGAFGGMAAWVVGPTKALAIAADDGCAPKCFQMTGKAPRSVLYTQWAIVLLLCASYQAFPTITLGYALLSDLTSEIALLFYVVFFVAAIRLSHTMPSSRNHFSIPGGKLGTWLVGGIGIVTCVVAMIAGLDLPQQLKLMSPGTAAWIMMTLLLIITVVPFWLSRKSGVKSIQ